MEARGRREAPQEVDHQGGRGEALGHPEEALAWEAAYWGGGREGARRGGRVVGL